MSKTKKSFEVRHLQVDITTENGKGYFIIGDTVLVDYGLPCMKLQGVVKYFKQKENFQRIYIHLNEPVTIIHEGNKFKNEIKNNTIRRSKKVG